MDIYTKNTWADICSKHDYQKITKTDWGSYKRLIRERREEANKLASLKACRKKLNHGLIYFHVPKAAGRWMRRFCEASLGSKFIYIHDHRSVRTIPNINRDQWKHYQESYLIVSVVRNPFQILLSMFNHQEHNGPSPPGWWNCKNWVPAGGKVNEFLKNFPNPHASGPGEQKKWIFRRTLFHQTYHKGSASCADVFIRYERLEEGLRLLFDEKSVKHHLKAIIGAGRAGGGKGYKDVYDAKAIKSVEKTYAWELEQFGYSFDGPTDDRALIFPWEINGIPPIP